jgi:hypothetical protein
MRLLLGVAALGLGVLTLKAEDWTTTDGRIYKDVKVVSHDALIVRIMDSDGGADISLAILPPDSQKKFEYDPQKAAELQKEQEAKQKAQEDEMKAEISHQIALVKELFSNAFSQPPKSASLYSIDPEPVQKDAKGSQFHRYPVLGQMNLDEKQTHLAADTIEKAATDWNGVQADCFNPRTALRISSGGHTYDFLICYQCAGLECYKDDQSVASTGVTGSPEVLNGLLTDAHIPLAKVDYESPEELSAYAKKQKEAEARWVAGMPKSIQAIWQWNEAYQAPMPDVSLYRGLLVREFPDEGARILKLLEWYGSGEGPWTGFGSYEEAPELLLFDYPTPVILKAIQSTTLNDAQLEGAARFFGDWDFSRRRPNDLRLLSVDLKQQLLKEAFKGNDADKAERAKKAFQQ